MFFQKNTNNIAQKLSKNLFIAQHCQAPKMHILGL